MSKFFHNCAHLWWQRVSPWSLRKNDAVNLYVSCSSLLQTYIELIIVITLLLPRYVALHSLNEVQCVFLCWSRFYSKSYLLLRWADITKCMPGTEASHKVSSYLASLMKWFNSWHVFCTYCRYISLSTVNIWHIIEQRFLTCVITLKAVIWHFWDLIQIIVVLVTLHKSISTL